jgi:hypothetical protein
MANRIKLELGWAGGALDVVIADGWALVTQRPEQRQRRPWPQRCVRHVHRRGRRGRPRRATAPPPQPAQRGRCHERLVAALTDDGALALCGPGLIAALAPAHIARLLAGADEPTAEPAGDSADIDTDMLLPYITHTGRPLNTDPTTGPTPDPTLPADLTDTALDDPAVDLLACQSGDNRRVSPGLRLRGLCGTMASGTGGSDLADDAGSMSTMIGGEYEPGLVGQAGSSQHLADHSCRGVAALLGALRRRRTRGWQRHRVRAVRRKPGEELADRCRIR